MAVAIDVVAASGAQSASTVTYAHTVSGSNRQLLVCVGCSNVTVSSVTYHGVSLTKVGSALSNDSVIDGEIWGLNNPDTGANNVVVTLSGTNDFNAISVSFTGVDPGTPLGTAVADAYTASGTATSHNTTVLTNGIICDLFYLRKTGAPLTVNGGQTTQSGPTDDATGESIVTTATGSGSVSTGYSWTNDFNRWAHVSVGVNPVAAAVDTTAAFPQPLGYRSALGRYTALAVLATGLISQPATDLPPVIPPSPVPAVQSIQGTSRVAQDAQGYANRATLLSLYGFGGHQPAGTAITGLPVYQPPIAGTAALGITQQAYRQQAVRSLGWTTYAPPEPAILVYPATTMLTGAFLPKEPLSAQQAWTQLAWMPAQDVSALPTQPDTAIQPIQGTTWIATQATLWAARVARTAGLRLLAPTDITAVVIPPDPQIQPIAGQGALARSAQTFLKTSVTTASLGWMTANDTSALPVQPDPAIQPVAGVAATRLAQRQFLARVGQTSGLIWTTAQDLTSASQPDTYVAPIAGTGQFGVGLQQARHLALIAHAQGWTPAADSSTVLAPVDTVPAPIPGTAALASQRAQWLARTAVARRYVSNVPEDVTPSGSAGSLCHTEVVRPQPRLMTVRAENRRMQTRIENRTVIVPVQVRTMTAEC